MGLLFSRKVQKNSKDILESLEKLIQSKTSSRRRNQQYERSFVSYLLLISFTLYLVGVAFLYLYFRPSTWPEWLVCLAPLVLFPPVVYVIKKLLNLYFSRRKTLFDQELATLHEEKRKVLNEMMEKETYKTAIELLQRFEPTHPSLLQLTPTSNPQSTPSSRSSRKSEVRRRTTSHPHPSMMHQATPIPPPSSAVQPTPSRPPVSTPMPHPPRIPSAQRSAEGDATSTEQQPFIPPGMCLGAPPGPPTPCPILPRDRSSVDKVVEYLVGDGPNNRYALICHNCHSHNGMALRDEFEYTSFRCAYCFNLNAARQKKPTMKRQTAKLPSKKRSLEEQEVPKEAPPPILNPEPTEVTGDLNNLPQSPE